MESCYFFVDSTGPEEKIAALCMDCGTKYSEDCWFWDGDQGYGPWLYQCSECNHIIYDYEKEESWEN